MIYLDVQEIITSYLENLINSLIEPNTNEFKFGYYNFIKPNTFTFTERNGAKYETTKFIPATIENWDGGFDPIPGKIYGEFTIDLTIMIQLNKDKDSTILALNRLFKELIGKYAVIEVKDLETEETQDVYLALGAGILRNIGAAITWGGRRYFRAMMPIDFTFSDKILLGNTVQNYLDGVLLAPVNRIHNREMEPHPVQLLTSGIATSKQTKKNINKENAWSSTLTFSWDDTTDFIIKYLQNPVFDQHREFVHGLTLNDVTYLRTVNIISSNFVPEMGKGADITITITTAFEEADG